MNNNEKSRLGRNAELGFLYKKSSIRASVISEMALVPEYIEALKAYNGELNDCTIYEVLKATYKQMLENGKSYRTARDVMNKVSKDVKGDSTAWKSN